VGLFVCSVTPHRITKPETANNAVTGTAMIPLLALGIPSIPATALLISALTIHGVQPARCC